MARDVTVQTNAQLYFAEPSPGALNTEGEAEIAPAPGFSVAGGVFTNDQVVELTSTIPGAIIRYTLDGGLPTEDSPQYTTPLTITNSAMVTAKVYATGYLPSRNASQSYTLLDANAAAFSSNLPLMIINTFGQVLQQNMDPRATAAIAVIDKPKLADRVTLLDRPDYHGRAGVEGRGQSSWGFPKKGINVETRDDNDQDKAVSLLGMPAESDWALYNPYSDKTFLNNFLAYELHEKMGHYAVRRRFVEVFLNGSWQGGTADTSGKVGTNDYVGIYVLVEKIKIDKHRVDIAKLGPEDNTEPAITGGYIWKRDKGSPGDQVFTTLTQTSTDLAGESLKYHDPSAQELTPAQKSWLTNYLNEFEGVLYGPNWRDPVNGYGKYINVKSFVDFHWIVEFAKQIDGYRLSNYLHKDRGGKIFMDPIWDWNLSFGNANYLDGGLTNGWYYALITPAQHMYLDRLVGDGSSNTGDPDFVQKTIDRWGELRVGLFAPSNLLARIDELTNYLAEAQARDFARWPRLSAWVWPNPDGNNLVDTSIDATTASWNVNYATPGSYANLINEMKRWITGRFGWIDALYLKAPTFNRYTNNPATPLSMTAPAGTIYYTLDGSDPRLPGGRISPNAVAYSGAFTPSDTARIVARSWLTNSWSPPASAIMGYPIPSLAITELMYHPAPGLGYNDEDFEYVELTNAGTNALDLTGITLSDGIDFTFPAGPLETTGTATTNNFDSSGTSYTASQLGAGPGAVVTTGGPAGSFLRLATQATGVNRNRITFDQTAAGPYDIVTADFDFRANNATPPPTAGTPTTQNFDEAGTAYTVMSYDIAEPATPAVMAADAGSTGQYCTHHSPSRQRERRGVFRCHRRFGIQLRRH